MEKVKFDCNDCIMDDDSLHDDIYFSVLSSDFDIPEDPIDYDFSDFGF